MVETEILATVERIPLHDEMGKLQMISHAPLIAAAATATILLFAQAFTVRGNPSRVAKCEITALVVCVILFYAAVALSLLMHIDMEDNGHVEYHLGKAEYGTVGAAILAFLVLVLVKGYYGPSWKLGTSTEPKIGVLYYLLLALFALTALLAGYHFGVGNGYWRTHKQTEAHQTEQLSRAFEIYNLWHMQFHVYAGYAALFIVLLYGALRHNPNFTPSKSSLSPAPMPK
jgi:prepilin signal peptidase PulO-like enzyme (type II secretory pathway)